MQRSTISRALAALALAISAAPALATCSAPDTWNGYDKKLHVAVAGGISMFVAAEKGDAARGFLAGAGAGVLKEALDAAGNGQCSRKDLAASLLGAALGAYTGHLLFIRSQGTNTVAYATRF